MNIAEEAPDPMEKFKMKSKWTLPMADNYSQAKREYDAMSGARAKFVVERNENLRAAIDSIVDEGAKEDAREELFELLRDNAKLLRLVLEPFEVDTI